MPRRITAPVKVQIQNLVNLLSEWLPMSAYNKKAVTYTSIFRESKLASSLEGNNKKQKLQNAWEEVYRNHERLPYTLTRKIVHAAIDYRFNQRNPLTREELDQLSCIVTDLGYDMEKELKAVKLKEDLPEIKIPPAQLIQRLESHPLVSEIVGEPLQLFKNGHFNESVRKVCERFEVKVQALASSTEIGKTLMGKVFNVASPLIALNSLTSENEKGIQEGYQLMAMGAMRGIRNIFSHGDENQRTPEDCYEMLMFINWLFKQLP